MNASSFSAPLSPIAASDWPEIPFIPERIQASLTSVYREFVFLTAATTPSTLLQALEGQLPHISRDSWPERIARGGTYVNGALALSDMTLPCPCRIEYYEPRLPADDRFAAFAASIDRSVVFEDEELLVVYKPAGISSMPTREQRNLNLKCFLEDYLRRSDPAASLHMPSRVDTSVEGLVIASKNRRMHAALQRVFERRAITKTYALLSDRSVAWTTLEANRSIARDFRHPVLRKTVTSGGQASQTIFHRIEVASDGRSLIAAMPVTGRTHQIRLHAASYGFPILGDNFYAGTPAEHLHLVSAQAEFQHPHSHRRLLLRAPTALLPAWLTQTFFDRLPGIAQKGA